MLEANMNRVPILEIRCNQNFENVVRIGLWSHFHVHSPSTMNNKLSTHFLLQGNPRLLRDSSHVSMDSLEILRLKVLVSICFVNICKL